MSGTFDPYHRWLGIPPKAQPPNYYRLLGLELFEADADVIRDAAEQRMAHVRNYQLGQYSELTQRILNELATAKGCLIDPKDKAIYDASLPRRPAASAMAALVKNREPPPLRLRTAHATPASETASKVAKSDSAPARLEATAHIGRPGLRLAMVAALVACQVWLCWMFYQQRRAWLAAEARAQQAIQFATATTTELNAALEALKKARSEASQKGADLDAAQEELARAIANREQLEKEVAPLLDKLDKLEGRGKAEPKVPVAKDHETATTDSSTQPIPTIPAMGPYPKLHSLRGRCAAFSPAFSPDGQEILTGCSDGSAVLWDADTGERRQALENPAFSNRRVDCVAFSPDGRLIAIAHDAWITLWRAADNKVPTKGSRDWSINNVHFGVPPFVVSNVVIDDASRRRTVLAEVANRSIVSWYATGKKRGEFPPGWTRPELVAIGATGRRVLAVFAELSGKSADTWRVEVWNADTGAKVNAFRIARMAMVAAAFSPDEHDIITRWADGTATLWTDTGECVCQLKTNGVKMTCAAVSHDDRGVLAGYEDGSAEIWDVASAKVLDRFRGHAKAVTSAVFSPNGRRAFTASLEDNTVVVWDVASPVPASPRKPAAKEPTDGRNL